MSFNGAVFFLGTNNLHMIHEFYHGILGLPLYKDQGLCRIYSVPGGGKIGFCSHLDVAKKGRSPIITLLTDDVDGTFEKLKESGVEVLENPKENRKFNIYHFFVRDPEGYLVEIQKFL